jgi:sarcosine oxidase subunit gamma
MVEALPPCARFALRLRPTTAAELRAIAGFQLDLPINRCNRSGARLSARLGPDEWMLLAPEREAGEIQRDVERGLESHVNSLVDIGHRNLSFEVSGPRARDIINGGCPLDLRDGEFAAGAATRTVMGKAEIILMRPAADDTFRIECARSYAPYVQDCLHEIAADCLALRT